MKHLFLTFTLFLSFYGSTQEPVVALESPEMNILYRGYHNIINVAVSNTNGNEITLGGANYSARRVGNLNQFTVVPGEGSTTTLHVLLVDGREIDTVRTIEYRVSNLPDPCIYWGGAKNGGKANIRQSKLFVKYPPQIPLRASFTVLSWEMSAGNDTIQGTGPLLSPAKEILQTVDSETIISFQVTYVGPDNVTRKRKATWIVAPWKDQSNETIIFKCG